MMSADRRTTRGLLTALFLLVTGPALAADGLSEAVTGEEVSALVSGWNIKAELGRDSTGDPIIKAQTDAGAFVILLNDCTKAQPVKCRSLTLYAGYALEKPFPLKSINSWNKQNRNTRAYIDADDDPILEMDIPLNGGLSAESLRARFSIWDERLADFRRLAMPEKPAAP